MRPTSVTVIAGSTGAFEILSIDAAQKRISLAPVDEGSSRAAALREDAAETPAQTGSLGSLGDTLRDALKERS